MLDLFRIFSTGFYPKLIAFLLISLIFIYRWIRDKSAQYETAKRSRIQRLIENLSVKNNSNNAFIIEQSFLDRYGSLLNYKEINYFLRQENPSHLIAEYIHARPWLKFNDEHTHLTPRGKLQLKHMRLILWPLNIIFVLSSMFGILGIIAATTQVLNTQPTIEILTSLTISVFSFLYAWIFFFIITSFESSLQLQEIVKE